MMVMKKNPPKSKRIKVMDRINEKPTEMFIICKKIV